MKNVIVPVDFSETSLNAARYAAKLLTGVYGVTMTLYHAYERPEHREAAESQLEKLRRELFDTAIVKMKTMHEEHYDFSACFERFVNDTRPDLVIMGISGRNKLGQTLVGSNTLQITRKAPCPVLIVPPAANFSRLKNFALTSDFSQAPSKEAIAVIRNLLSTYFAKLHILNVNPEHNITITEKFSAVKNQMEGQFQGYEHAFYFVELFDLHETLNLFVNDHQIDMVITLPKDHSWFSSLLSGSHTKKMAYQSTVPVLAIRS